MLYFFSHRFHGFSQMMLFFHAANDRIFDRIGFFLLGMINGSDKNLLNLQNLREHKNTAQKITCFEKQVMDIIC